jgi:hypothetical protein
VDIIFLYNNEQEIALPFGVPQKTVFLSLHYFTEFFNFNNQVYPPAKSLFVSSAACPAQTRQISVYSFGASGILFVRF